MKKKTALWITLLVIGTVPFVLALLLSVNAAVNGFSFLWAPAEYGFEAFTGYLLMFSYLYWPGYIIGLILIIAALVALIPQK